MFSSTMQCTYIVYNCSHCLYESVNDLVVCVWPAFDDLIMSDNMLHDLFEECYGVLVRELGVHDCVVGI
jgi:hypothetical protein